MLDVGIKKVDGLEGLVRGYTSQQPEDEREVATVGDNKFAALLKKYEAFLGMYDEYQKVIDKSNWIRNCIHCSLSITDILSSEEINQFLQITIIYEAREEYNGLTGIFITQLIQNSYNAGNNDFQLDTRSLTKNLHWLGAYLEGKEKRKLHLSITGDVGDRCGEFANNSTYTITGNVGDRCGSSAKNCTYNITGNVGDMCYGGAKNCTYNITGNVGILCGSSAKNCTYNITGNVGGWCGKETNNSTYNITGNVGNWCGSSAKNCTYNITGNVGDLCGSWANNSIYYITGNVGDRCGSWANNSTFKTPNKETLKKLRKDVPILPNNILDNTILDNTIIYVKQDATEEVIR